MLKLLSYIPPHNTRYERICAPASTLYSQKNDILGITDDTAYCVL